MTFDLVCSWAPGCQPARRVRLGHPKRTGLVFVESANLAFEWDPAHDLSGVAVKLFQPTGTRHPESSLSVLSRLIDAIFGNAGGIMRSVNKPDGSADSGIKSVKSSLGRQPQYASAILTDALDRGGQLIGSPCDAIMRKGLCRRLKSVEKLVTADP